MKSHRLFVTGRPGRTCSGQRRAQSPITTKPLLIRRGGLPNLHRYVGVDGDGRDCGSRCGHQGHGHRRNGRLVTDAFLNAASAWTLGRATEGGEDAERVKAERGAGERRAGPNEWAPRERKHTPSESRPSSTERVRRKTRRMSGHIVCRTSERRASETTQRE